MTRRLAWLIADGLRADTARDVMGFMVALEQAGRAQWREVECELPGVSRPIYATLATGLAPLAHGILSNAQAGQGCGHTLFHELAQAGVTSCAAAYHWWRELLTGEMFDALRHRDSPAPPLLAARWYFEDDYPDSHCFADAEALRLAHDPGLLMVHPMGLDLAGHRHGGGSDGYRLAARRLDALLAHVLPRWHAAGVDLLLTADHGMHPDRMHGGADPAERKVPLIWAPAEPADAGAPLPVSQCGIPHFIRARLTENS